MELRGGVKEDGLAEKAAERWFRAIWDRTLPSEGQVKWGSHVELYGEFVYERPVNIGSGASSLKLGGSV